MRLVFTAEEVAAALQKSVDEFVRLRPTLEACGFPKPLQGLNDRWPIMEIINWVNHHGSPADLTSSDNAGLSRSPKQLS